MTHQYAMGIRFVDWVKITHLNFTKEFKIHQWSTRAFESDRFSFVANDCGKSFKAPHVESMYLRSTQSCLRIILYLSEHTQLVFYQQFFAKIFISNRYSNFLFHFFRVRIL